MFSLDFILLLYPLISCQGEKKKQGYVIRCHKKKNRNTVKEHEPKSSA